MANSPRPVVRSAAIIFRPLAEKLSGKRRRLFGGPVMTDQGDHIEYNDGETTVRWRLPDQTSGPSELPVLARVLVARFKTDIGHVPSHCRVIFQDEQGRTLGRVQGTILPPRHFLRLLLSKGTIPQADYELAFPPAVFEPLTRRGVIIIEETFTSGPAFQRAHPDPTLGGSERSFRRHPVLWIGGALLVIIIGYNLYLLATGYYGR